MRAKFLKSMLWTMGLQWRTSKLFFGWNIGYSLYDGLRPIVAAYAIAQLLTLVSRVALESAPVETSHIYGWLAVLMMLAFANEVLSFINWYMSGKFQREMRLNLQRILILKLYGLSQEQFDNQEFNTKIGRARASLNHFWRIVADIALGFSSLITLVTALIVIFATSYQVGLVIVVSLAPIIWVRNKMNVAEERAERRADPDRRLANRSSWMLVDPKHMVEIRLLNAFKKIVQVWRRHQRRSDRIIEGEHGRFVKYEVLVAAIHPLVNFGANIYFFRLLVAGSIGLGQFIFLRGILEETLRGAARATESARRLHGLSIDLQNFDDIRQARPAIAPGTARIKPPLTIEFRRVNFRYPGVRDMALKDLSFKIKPGEHLALVGENGAGKTTIIKLLMRQYLPTSGSVEVNGVDIRNLDPDGYYALISNLSQEFFLPEQLTIRENLLVGTAGRVSDKAIWRATDLAEATSFVKALPGQLATRLTPSFDDGTDLSAGQRQRLCVARTLLRDTALMILDEPTSAIDARAEYAIFSNIYKKQTDKAVLIVSHRFSTVRQADKILVIRRGQVAEQGSHEELMDADGFYKEAFNLQAEGYR